MNSFKWHREFVAPESYIRNMGISKEKENNTSFYIPIKDSANDGNVKTITISQKFLDALHGSKKLTAYKVAADIRKFEIELSWKRATFFWAFIVAIYTAYYHVLTKIYAVKCKDITHYQHGALPLLVLPALGLFICFSWLLTSKGSRHWQEKLATPKLTNTYFTEINDLTELQYATKILKDYGTVFVVCRAEKETRYFQAVKLEDSTIFVLYFSADELKN